MKKKKRLGTAALGLRWLMDIVRYQSQGGHEETQRPKRCNRRLRKIRIKMANGGNNYKFSNAFPCVHIFIILTIIFIIIIFNIILTTTIIFIILTIRIKMANGGNNYKFSNAFPYVHVFIILTIIFIILTIRMKMANGGNDSAVVWQNPLTPNFEISFFCIFSIVTPMSFLCAYIEFILLTDFELSMVAKIVKIFKK